MSLIAPAAKMVSLPTTVHAEGRSNLANFLPLATRPSHGCGLPEHDALLTIFFADAVSGVSPSARASIVLDVHVLGFSFPANQTKIKWMWNSGSR